MRKEREFRYYSDIHSIICSMEKGFLRKRNPVKAIFSFTKSHPDITTKLVSFLYLRIIFAASIPFISGIL